LTAETQVRTLSGLRALLFDLDGTLVVPTIDFGQLNATVRAIIRAYGAEETLAQHQPALEAIEAAAAWLDGLGRPGAADLRSSGLRSIADIELAAAELAVPFVGVPQMLATLKGQGLSVGIVTRNSRRAAERILQRGGLAYDVLLTRDDVCRVKPNPEHLCAALAMLGISPLDAAMCGDHVMDVEAGKRAGMRTVGVLSGASRRTELIEAGADVVLEWITALPRYLGIREVAR